MCALELKAFPRTVLSGLASLPPQDSEMANMPGSASRRHSRSSVCAPSTPVSLYQLAIPFVLSSLYLSIRSHCAPSSCLRVSPSHNLL